MTPLCPLALCLAFVAAAAPPPPSQTEAQVSDSALSQGIALVRDGEYDAGLTAIDSALSHLPGGAGRSAERALGHLYAGVALIAKGQSASAKARFRKALEENPALRVSPQRFPPKVTELFSAAKAELARSPAAGAPTPAPVKREPLELRLVRSTSGSRGSTRSGRFQVEDPRSVFEVPDDKQVVVHFEWEGPPGSYLLEGAWRDPAGVLTLQPQVETKGAGGRVGSYWFLALPPSMTPGQWTLEVTHEGRAVGQHAIQVASKKTAGEAVLSPNPTEVLAKVVPSVVVIEKRDKEGKRFGQGLGFFVREDLVATAFQVIEGARNLRVVLRDERSFVVEEVAASNRWQDWALLKLPSGPHPALALAQATGSSIPCYLVNVDDSGSNPTLTTWLASPGPRHPKGGDRLKLEYLRPDVTGITVRVPDTGGWVERAAIGGPILNARGEVVGILGGSFVPGESTADLRVSKATALVTPAALIAIPEGPATPLRALIASGLSLEPASKSELSRATFARTVEKRIEGLRGPVDEGVEFTRGDATVMLWALWHPQRSRKMRLRLRLYDLDGTLVAEDKPVVTGFRRGVVESSTWTLPVAGRATGIYRVDILDDEKVVWRGFFRLGA